MIIFKGKSSINSLKAMKFSVRIPSLKRFILSKMKTKLTLLVMKLTSEMNVACLRSNLL